MDKAYFEEVLMPEWLSRPEVLRGDVELPSRPHPDLVIVPQPHCQNPERCKSKSDNHCRSCASKAVWQNPETREFIRERLREARRRPETIEKFRKAMREKYWDNAVWCEKRDAAAAEAVRKPEERKRRAKEMRERWSEPGFRERRAKEMRECWKSEGFRERRKLARLRRELGRHLTAYERERYIAALAEGKGRAEAMEAAIAAGAEKQSEVA